MNEFIFIHPTDVCTVHTYEENKLLGELGEITCTVIPIVSIGILTISVSSRAGLVWSGLAYTPCDVFSLCLEWMDGWMDGWLGLN